MAGSAFDPARPPYLFGAFLNANCSLVSMVMKLSRRHGGDMTKLTNRKTEQTAPRRTRGFASELAYLVVVATSFNAVALAAVALASDLAGPVQAVVGVSVFAALLVASSAAIRGVRFFGQGGTDGIASGTRSTKAMGRRRPSAGLT